MSVSVCEVLNLRQSCQFQKNEDSQCLYSRQIPGCLGSITADIFSGIWEARSSPEAITDIKRAAVYTLPSPGPFQHHCIKLNLIWHLCSLHKYFIFIWKFGSGCFTLHMPALSEREQRRHRYSIIQPDYLCAELWNRFVFVCGFFWSDRSLWKTSFMALASQRAWPHLSTRTQPCCSCAQHKQDVWGFFIYSIYLLSEPWIVMASLPLFMMEGLCCFSGC